MLVYIVVDALGVLNTTQPLLLTPVIARMIHTDQVTRSCKFKLIAHFSYISYAQSSQRNDVNAILAGVSYARTGDDIE